MSQPNRWQARKQQGHFVPRSELSAQQQAILAAVPRYKREWVRPSSLKSGQSPKYKIMKWVMDTSSERQEGTEEEMAAALKVVASADATIDSMGVVDLASHNGITTHPRNNTTGDNTEVSTPVPTSAFASGDVTPALQEEELSSQHVQDLIPSISVVEETTIVEIKPETTTSSIDVKPVLDAANPIHTAESKASTTIPMVSATAAVDAAAAPVLAPVHPLSISTTASSLLTSEEGQHELTLPTSTPNPNPTKPAEGPAPSPDPKPSSSSSTDGVNANAVAALADVSTEVVPTGAALEHLVSGSGEKSARLEGDGSRDDFVEDEVQVAQEAMEGMEGVVD